MVSGPSIWSPLHHLHLSFLCLFTSFCGPRSVISHRSFFCAHTARPLALACTNTTCLQPRFQVVKDLTMRFGSLVVPARLVFPFVATTHTGLVLSSSHVFILLSPLRVHMRICSPETPWSHRGSFKFGKDPASLVGRRVCETLGVTGILLSWFYSPGFIAAGGTGPSWIPAPTKLFHDGGSGG